MKNKKIVFYTIYQDDKINNDLQYITNFDNLQQIADFLKIKKSTLKSQISQKQLIKDKYVILKDYITSQELESI